MHSILALAALAAPQSTWFVDVNGTSPGTGTDTDPYTSVEYAVSQSTTVAGDTVLVRPGIYFNEEIDFDGKDVRVVSVGGPGATELWAPSWSGSGPRHSVIQLTSGESQAALLEGFTVRGGSGAGTSTFGASGGAVLCQASGGTFRDCVFLENTAPAGGDLYSVVGNLLFEDCEFTLGIQFSEAVKGDAAYIVGGNATFRRCTFRDFFNTAIGTGSGAVAIEEAVVVVEDCHFRQNLNTRGPGSHLSAINATVLLKGTAFVDAPDEGSSAIASMFGTLIVEDCTIANNICLDCSGAGVSATGTDVFVYRSEFQGNRADRLIDLVRGGALFLDGCDAVVVDTLFDSNISSNGGAIAALSSDTTIVGCTVRDSSLRACSAACEGGGIYASQGTLNVERTVFRRNQAADGSTPGRGGASFVDSVVADFDHCTLINNNTGGSDMAMVGGVLTNSIVVGSSDMALNGTLASYSLIDEGYPGVGNFDGDPGFWSSTEAQLLPSSDAIDAGDPMAQLDADGTRSDIGAFPFDPWYCGSGCVGTIGSSMCATLPNSTGVPAVLMGLGSTDVATDRVILNSTNVPAGALGYMLTSQSPGFAVNFGGSAGVLCLGGSILRFSNTILRADGNGVMSFQPELWDFPQGTMVAAGDSWIFQAWFRDSVNGVATSNTTQSLRVTFL